MQVTSSPPARVQLHGQWTMNEASERHQLLAGELAGLLEAKPRPGCAQIDLGEVTGVDACGCQLLTVFLAQLHRHGIACEACGIPQQVAETISLLGFSDAWAMFAAPEKENL